MTCIFFIYYLLLILLPLFMPLLVLVFNLRCSVISGISLALGKPGVIMSCSLGTGPTRDSQRESGHRMSATKRKLQEPRQGWGLAWRKSRVGEFLMITNLLEDKVASEGGYLMPWREKGIFCPLNTRAAGYPEGVSAVNYPSMEAGLDSNFPAP